MNIYFFCIFQGNDFDPISLIDSHLFRVSRYHKVGDLSKDKRHYGRVLETGYICLEPKNEDFETFVNKLHSMKSTIVENNADRRVLHIYFYYTEQCNWEFSPYIMNLISELNLTLAISCIYMNESDS